tara:strand:+ start:4428 stop:5024 length:597 start_codon:yes stop_codon:yes gene_type:complete
MQVNVTSNVAFVEKRLNKIQKKQIPFATSVAINNTLFGLRKEMGKQVDKKLDRPTPFTKRGFLVDKAKKTKLFGILFMKNKVADYMQYQVDGGIRKETKMIPVPFKANARLNKYGNIIGKRTGLIKKNSQFIGTINGTTGVWERTNKNQRVKLMIGFEGQVNYKPRFPFYKIASKYSGRLFPKNFDRAITKALRTTRR